MSLPAQTDRETDPQDQARVVRAMDHVLEAERSAQSAVADFEQRTLAALEHARQQRRSLLERAHERIMALQARVAHTLELRIAQVREQQPEVPDRTAVQRADRDRLQAALEHLVERLTRVTDKDL